MKLGIVIFPSKMIQDKANGLRKRYDPHYALVPPHITLKTPFETQDEQLESIVKELHTIANRTNPFTLHVGKVGSFAPVNNVLYFKVEKRLNLLS